MNRQERRRRKRAGKKMQKRSNKRINAVEHHHIITSFTVAKLVSVMILRDKGYGNKRIKEFSAEFNTLLQTVSEGYLTSADIADTIYEETGVSMDDLRV